MLIPKIIHQLWVGPMVPGIRECLDSVTRVMPDHDVRVYGAGELNNIVPENLSPVEKSDVLRHRIVHDEGGWWLDADCFALKPLDGDCAYSLGSQECWQGQRVADALRGKFVPQWQSVCNYTFGSEAGNPDQKACELAVLGQTTDYVKGWGGNRGFSNIVGGRTLLPANVYGSRYFAENNPSKHRPMGATTVHLFLSSWVKRSWEGVLAKAQEVMRWR